MRYDFLSYNTFIALTPWLLKIATFSVILFFFWLIGCTFKKLLLKLAEKVDRKQQKTFHLLANIANIVLLVLGVISALSSIGVNVNALIASLSLSGFALSFVFKDVLANVLAGMLIFIYKPFKLGDKVEICDLAGRVSKIDLRYIYLDSENKIMLIPNASLLTHNIIILKANENL